MLMLHYNEYRWYVDVPMNATEVITNSTLPATGTTSAPAKIIGQSAPNPGQDNSTFFKEIIYEDDAFWEWEYEREGYWDQLW